jgi:hypothetical protein
VAFFFIGKRNYQVALMLSVVPLVAVAAVILGDSSGNIQNVQDKVAESQVVVGKPARHQYCQAFAMNGTEIAPAGKKLKKSLPLLLRWKIPVTLHPSFVSLELLAVVWFGVRLSIN